MRSPVSLVGRLTSEPVVRFTAVGGLLFALYYGVQWAHRPPACSSSGTAPSTDILLDEAFVRSALGQNPVPEDGMSPERRRALIQQAVDDEILYREAKALRIDEHDPEVRRRLVEMAEVFLEQQDSTLPKDEQMTAFYADHPELFRKPATVSFHQVFFSREGRSAGAAADAVRALRELADGRPAVRRGDAFLAGSVFVHQTEAELAGVFGSEAARTIMALPVGVWSGPIASSYGEHLVNLDERQPEARAPLAEVVPQVRDALLDQARRQSFELGMARLRRKYRVRAPGPMNLSPDPQLERTP